MSMGQSFISRKHLPQYLGFQSGIQHQAQYTFCCQNLEERTQPNPKQGNKSKKFHHHH